MFLEDPNLDALFRVLHERKAYMIYANTGSMKCFECGDVGHKRLACPHKAGNSGENTGPSTATVIMNASEDVLAPVVEKRDAQIVVQAETVIDNGQNGKVVAGAEESVM